jgi:hypothetical protein
MERTISLLLDNWVVLLILGGAATGVITSLAKHLRKYGCFRQEVALKRELVERGLSVEEIERVIAAKSSITSKENDA